MRVRLVLVMIVVLAVAASVAAQTTTGTISGRVLDSQGGALPGATVTAKSPNLQGSREAVTSANGDYILTGLPSGPYTISVTLSGFQTYTRPVVLAPTQVVPLEVTLGPAQVTEEVTVTARSADTLTNTSQIATNFSQDLIATLPTARDLNSILLMAPGVHPTGPAGAFSFGGSVSFENLFLLNGVSINENIRGQAFDTAIEDAIQETTVANGGVSAEFGRFSGGVVNIITKSGGNQFSGSLRNSLNNDKWRTLTPFESDRLTTTPEPRVDKTVPTYEYTLGGPILRDRLWFFTSGRLRDESQGRTLIGTQVPYTFTEEQRRYEIKGTYSMTPKHRFQVNYNRHDRDQVNYSFNQNTSMDLRSLGTRTLPERLYAGTYTGTLTSKLFVEASVSKRTLRFFGAGAKSTDLIEGTLLIDNSRGGTRWWSDTFCGVCTPEGRDAEEVFTKASYFLSTPRFGSHNLVFGYDMFNDIRQANNHQSGSDYRILSAGAILSGNGAGPNDLFPIFLGDGTTTIQWNPILQESEGTSFRTHSGFINDTWRINQYLTANAGLRYDKNDGKDQSGNVVAKDAAFSPRFGLIYDPTGSGNWSFTASVAKYVAAISNPVADSSAAGGNPQQQQFIYRGPSINGPGTSPLVATPVAIRSVFDWFFANGGPTLPLASAPTIPGVTPRIDSTLSSPSAWEYAGGVSRTWGGRASLRADLLVRHYINFYMRQTDTTTGKVTDPITGRNFDLSLVTNAPDGLLSRDYAGGTFSGSYRFGRTLDVGANYTLSKASGNFDAETVAGGPTPFDYRYPEYKQESWNFPDGDLAVDQRHRARFWVNYSPDFAPGLTVSVLQALESGVPYGAANTNGLNVQQYVTNPGYLSPPGSTATTYFFGPRDEFHTEGQKRTDLAFNYARQVPGVSRMQLFAQVQVLNIFNQFQLCACGSTVFGTGSAANAGGVNLQRIDTTVLTPGTTASRFATFNPFTTTPVRGVNWDYGPDFGTALTRFAWTTPRTVRMSFGVRF
jgi:outer membrane receptor for ferrienterochelin and colicin